MVRRPDEAIFPLRVISLVNRQALDASAVVRGLLHVKGVGFWSGRMASCLALTALQPHPFTISLIHIRRFQLLAHEGERVEGEAAGEAGAEGLQLGSGKNFEVVQPLKPVQL